MSPVACFFKKARWYQEGKYLHLITADPGILLDLFDEAKTLPQKCISICTLSFILSSYRAIIQYLKNLANLLILNCQFQTFEQPDSHTHFVPQSQTPVFETYNPQFVGIQEEHKSNHAGYRCGCSWPWY